MKYFLIFTSLLLFVFTELFAQGTCPTDPNIVCNCATTFAAPPNNNCGSTPQLTNPTTRTAAIVDPCTGIVHDITITGPMLVRGVYQNFNYGDYACPMVNNNDGTRTYITTDNSSALTYTFDPPLKNPNMFIKSLGNPSRTLSYTFTDGAGNPVEATILAQDPSAPNPLGLSNIYDTATGLNNTVFGPEVGGVISFNGTFSTIVAEPDDFNPNDGFGTYECYALFTLSVCRETTPELVLSDEVLDGCSSDDLSVNGYLPLSTTPSGITEFQLAGDGAVYPGVDGPLVNVSYVDVVDQASCPTQITRTYSIENCGGCETSTCSRTFTIDAPLDGTPVLNCPTEIDICSGSPANLGQDFLSNIGNVGAPFTGTFSGPLAPYIIGNTAPGGNASLQIPSGEPLSTTTLTYTVTNSCGCTTLETSCDISLVCNCPAKAGKF